MNSAWRKIDDELFAEENHIIDVLKKLKEEQFMDPAFAEAVVDAVIYEVVKGSLLPFIRTHPEITIKFIGTFLEKLTKAYSIIEKSITKNLGQRICLTLLRLSESLVDDRPSDKNFVVPISKDDLGVIVGSTREAILRVMANLEGEGILALWENEIVIMDYDGLKKLVCDFDK